MSGAALAQRPCVEVRDSASAHLADVRKKLADLQALGSSSSAFVVSCDTTCAGPSVDCTVLEDLAHPADAARLVNGSPVLWDIGKPHIRSNTMRDRRTRLASAACAAVVPSALLVDASGAVGAAYGAKTANHMFIVATTAGLSTRVESMMA